MLEQRFPKCCWVGWNCLNRSEERPKQLRTDGVQEDAGNLLGIGHCEVTVRLMEADSRR